MKRAPKYLRELIRPHRGKIVLALGLNAGTGIVMAFQNVVPKFIIDDALLAKGIDMDERQLRLIYWVGLYIILGIFFRALIWNLSLRIFGRVREEVLFGLRSLFFRHINRLCLDFHTRHQSGELFSYLLGSPLQQVQQYYQQMALQIPSQVVALVLTLVFLGAWDFGLSALMLGILIVYFYVLQKAKRKMRAIHKDYQNTESQVSGKVADLLRGHRAVKMHAFEDTAAEDFDERAKLIRDKSYWRDVTNHMQHVKQESVLYIGYGLLCVAAGWRFLEGGLTEGQLTAYLTSFIALQGPLRTFFQVGLLRGSSQASLDRINEVLNTGSTTPDPVEDCLVPPRGDIIFRDVTFSYDGNLQALKNINLTIPRGQNVALVGSSGAGKSTLVQLVLRLYDPDEGAVEIGYVDLRHLKGKELRSHFGVVPQDPYFFTSTIRENLRVAAPNASDEALIAACREANAWEFIERIPKQLDEVIGEGGSTLSGGQKQRLAIARAILSKPNYFIFDEATSALDTVSERLIRDAIARITKEKTSIFIAHRLVSITHCDRILVLEDGRIVQDGSFEELAHTEGRFQHLLNTQRWAEN